MGKKNIFTNLKIVSGPSIDDIYLAEMYNIVDCGFSINMINEYESSENKRVKHFSSDITVNLEILDCRSSDELIFQQYELPYPKQYVQSGQLLKITVSYKLLRGYILYDCDSRQGYFLEIEKL